MANEFYECAKIQSSFKQDNLEFPKSGECSFFNSYNSNKLVLRVKKDKLFFDQQDDQFETKFHIINRLNVKDIDFKDEEMTVVFELMNGKIELCFKERNQYDSFRNKIIELLDADEDSLQFTHRKRKTARSFPVYVKKRQQKITKYKKMFD